MLPLLPQACLSLLLVQVSLFLLCFEQSKLHAVLGNLRN
jgi:hypothetical protein